MKKWISGIATCLVIASVSVYSASPSAKTAIDNTYDQLKLLVDVMGIIKENYVEERDSKSLLTGAINGMVHTLDPFSQFMEPEAYKDMKTETEGQFGGLGIRISTKNDWLTVITPLPGTPAYRLGILPDDKIIKIENQSTVGMKVDDAVKLLRGSPGTKVTITIAREGTAEPIVYTITREIIKIETITSRMLNDNIGYIRLTEFNASSGRDLNKALSGLDEKGMKNLVFDLRNNPGGLLDVAVDVCKEFIGEKKLIVYTQGRHPESRREYRADDKAPYEGLPVVVLVNRGSASASEIVSGAMQDLKRGLILGTTTFGKGSVQSLLPLPEGNALKLTTAKYYLATGRCIHRDEKTGKGGITPDIIIDVPKDIEAKLYMQSEEIFTTGKEPKSSVKKEDIVKDEALDKAIELLKARSVFVNLQDR